MCAVATEGQRGGEQKDCPKYALPLQGCAILFQRLRLCALLQDPGLSPDTIFFNLFFKNLAADLKNDKALLASISNASLVVGGPNQGKPIPHNPSDRSADDIMQLQQAETSKSDMQTGPVRAHRGSPLLPYNWQLPMS